MGLIIMVLQIIKKHVLFPSSFYFFFLRKDNCFKIFHHEGFMSQLGASNLIESSVFVSLQDNYGTIGNILNQLSLFKRDFINLCL